jgi:glycine/D-amino acid oxidase-like deaminating enzyme
MNEPDYKWLTELGQLLWARKDQIARNLVELRDWLFPRKKAGILIIGPGGVGKSTTARFLSGEFTSPTEVPGKYDESLGLEVYPLDDDPRVELVVPPGQKHRRDATWNELERTISDGGYRGIILTCSFGYHSMGQYSYKDHGLYKGRLDEFMVAFLNDCRKEELAVLNRLSPHFCANDRKFWVLTLVTKQDLWWDNRSTVESHYREGKYADAMEQIAKRIGAANFRHEAVFASLVISNFVTGNGELLAETVAGYDQNLQAESLLRFIAVLDGLRHWEEKK